MRFVPNYPMICSVIQVLKFSPNDEPLMRIRFASDRDLNRRILIDRTDIPAPDLNELPVLPVSISLVPRRRKLKLQLTRAAWCSRYCAESIGRKLQATNFSVSAGDINDGGRRIRVQPVGEIRDLEQLRNLVINETGLKLSGHRRSTIETAENRFWPSSGRQACGGTRHFPRAKCQSCRSIQSGQCRSGCYFKNDPELDGSNSSVDDHAENVNISID